MIQSTDMVEPVMKRLTRQERKAMLEAGMMDELDFPMTSLDQMVHGLKYWSQRQGEAYFNIVDHPERGRCVVTKREFERGSFVMPYEGDFVTKKVKEAREAEYVKLKFGSYMVDVTWKEKACGIDGTLKEGTFGRLVNHARGPNLQPFHLIQIRPGAAPRMGFFACERIQEGEELYWDYGLKDGETEWATFRRPKKTRAPMVSEECNTCPALPALALATLTPLVNKVDSQVFPFSAILEPMVIEHSSPHMLRASGPPRSRLSLNKTKDIRRAMVPMEREECITATDPAPTLPLVWVTVLTAPARAPAPAPEMATSLVASMPLPPVAAAAAAAVHGGGAALTEDQKCTVCSQPNTSKLERKECLDLHSKEIGIWCEVFEPEVSGSCQDLSASRVGLSSLSGSNSRASQASNEPSVTKDSSPDTLTASSVPPSCVRCTENRSQQVALAPVLTDSGRPLTTNRGSENTPLWFSLKKEKVTVSEVNLDHQNSSAVLMPMDYEVCKTPTPLPVVALAPLIEYSNKDGNRLGGIEWQEVNRMLKEKTKKKKGHKRESSGLFAAHQEQSFLSWLKTGSNFPTLGVGCSCSGDYLTPNAVDVHVRRKKRRCTLYRITKRDNLIKRT